jgi:hypothetical protein
MNTSAHSLHSSYRESLLEHLFAGEIMRHLWLSDFKRLEVLKPQVDDGGYDLVLETASVVRHIQLKATFKGSKVSRFNIHTALASKPSGCVVVLKFDPETLDLGPFYWFGGLPKKPLPDLTEFPIAKHTKGNAEGIKNLRANIRVVPLSRFCEVATIEELSVKLFGDEAGDVDSSS